MQCPQCGATVIATAHFCPVCGQVFASPRPFPNPPDAAIYDAPTLVMPRGANVTVQVEPPISPTEVAVLMADVGKALVVGQWQRWWWKILIIGAGLYAVVNNVRFLTDNIFLLPQLFMIGTFLVPIVYIAYLYEDGTLYDVALSKLALIFFFGGVLGSIAASLLEARFLTTGNVGLFGQLSLLNSIIVGLSEELAKLIVVVPFLFAARRRYPTIMHGIVLGAAAGMGFAAFESMGYAFYALVATQGNMQESIEAMHTMIRLRALLAPLGHGTWTAIIAAAIWREWLTSRFPVNRNVLVAFLAAVLLHTLWDYVPTIGLGLIGVPLLHIVLGVVGLLMLRFFLRVAKGGRDGAYSEQNLLVALPMYFGGLRGEFRARVRGSRN